MTASLPVRLRSLDPGDAPLFARIASTVLENPVDVVIDPSAALSFGGEADNAFPPLWLFASQDECPSRNTTHFLFTEAERPAGLLEQLGGLPCRLAPQTLPESWEDWAEVMLDADFIITRSVRLAALANGLLKPALFLADFEAEAQTTSLPFTLGTPLSLVGRRLRGFDRHGSMGDLLNWKRLTERRLAETLRAEGGR